MADIIQSTGIAQPENSECRSLTIPATFRIQAVDERVEDLTPEDVLSQIRAHQKPLHQTLAKPAAPQAPQAPQAPLPGPTPILTPPPGVLLPNGALPGSLGHGLEKFVGTFKGRGMNTIFRPKNGFTDPRDDNLLELDLTTETLEFLDANILGDVPNRGFDKQVDVNLRGVPYTQRISNHLNPQTGKADSPTPTAIHFEQGLFMRTPETTSPKLGATISRMASIPHGTTINAQSFEPTSEIAGKPAINDVDITPFGIDSDVAHAGVTFDNMTNPGVTANRLPHDLGPFIAARTITLDILKNPNLILKANNENKDIVKHVTFTVKSSPTLSLPGGGTDNICFLAEPEIPATDPTTGQPTTVTFNPGFKQISRANADAVRMTCQYWISTVRHVIEIPPWNPGQPFPVLTPLNTHPDVQAPKAFKVELKRHVSKPTKVAVFSTQIQYSQNVQLNFNGLTWPHVSVASLVPAADFLIVKDSDLPASLN